MNNPQPGLTTAVNFKRAIDGDTITVEVVRHFNVRINGIDVFEKQTPQGQAAKEFTQKQLEEAKEIVIVVPSHRNSELMDIQSFNRIIADVWYDGKLLSEELDKAGFRKPVGEEHLGLKKKD